MNVFIGFLAIVGIVVGIPTGICELSKHKDRERCSTIAHTTHQELRFIEVHWMDWGCFAPQGEDWVDVESGRVIP